MSEMGDDAEIGLDGVVLSRFASFQQRVGCREYYQNFYCLCSRNVNQVDPWELRCHADDDS